MLKPPEERTIHYDKLNGERTVESTYEMVKTATKLGVGASAASVCLFFPKNFAEGALRSGNITGGFVILAAVFGLSTNISASVREKDGPLNYFIGGCTSGVLLGARMKSFPVGTCTCLAFGGWGAFYKTWMMNDYGKFLPAPKY